MPIETAMSKLPIQYFEETVVTLSSGAREVYRAFTDHFGDDFDAYILKSFSRSFADAQFGQYTDESFDWQMEQLNEELNCQAEMDESLHLDGNPNAPLCHSLLDIASDGTVYALPIDLPEIDPLQPDDEEGPDNPFMVAHRSDDQRWEGSEGIPL